MEESLTPADHVIVIFGATGDLARRELLPALTNLEQAGLMPRNYRVIGTARSQMSDEEFRELARGAVDEFGRAELSDDSWKDFATRLSFLSHDFGPDDTEPLEAAVRAKKKRSAGRSGASSTSRCRPKHSNR